MGTQSKGREQIERSYNQTANRNKLKWPGSDEEKGTMNRKSKGGILLKILYLIVL
jgi:hypothetical protein